ncbi:MAG: CvpA family protein [Chitinophagaceae bacterium]
MNIIDVLLLIIIFSAIWSGWHKGFIFGILDLVMLAGSLFAAFLFYPYLAVYIQKFFPSLGVWTLPLSFILTLLLARTFIGFVIRLILSAIPGTIHQHNANRFLGMFPGLINGLIYSIIVSALLLALPLFDGLSAKTRESQLAAKFIPPAEWLEEKFSPVFDEAVKRTMNKLTVEPQSKETVKLHFKVANPKIREDLEMRMLDLVNKEREQAGYKPVKADPEMTEMARRHSRDMFARGYFAHITPEGKNPFDRMRAGGVKFLTAGENLALGQTLTIAHNGLMNSPGHRANILQPAFGRLGIGILDGGVYGLMITQNFRN